MKDDSYRVLPIPQNYKNGINFMGFSFDVRNLLEGLVLAFIGAAIGYFIIYELVLETNPKALIVGVLTPAVSLGFLGLRGINGTSFSKFIIDFFKTKQRSRICYYNPQIKIKAKSFNSYDDREETEKLPREKVIELYNSYRTKLAERDGKQAPIEYSDADLKNLVFEDDIIEEENSIKKVQPKKGIKLWQRKKK